MSNKRIALFAVSALLAMAGCQSSMLPKMEIVSVVNAKSDLDGYETFKWAGAIETIKDKKDAWVPVGFDADAEVRYLVNRELRERGMIFAIDEPDAHVFYLMIVNMDAQEVRLKELYGHQIELDEAGEGALVVGVVDAETNRPVWVGAAKGGVDIERSDEEAMEILAEGVKRIFEGYKN